MADEVKTEDQQTMPPEAGMPEGAKPEPKPATKPKEVENFYSPSARGFFNTALHGKDIPADGIKITADQVASLLSAQAEGKIITVESGVPVAKEPPPPSEKQLLEFQIIKLEAQQTARRIREAALGKDGGWLAGIEAQIVALREKIKTL